MADVVSDKTLPGGLPSDITPNAHASGDGKRGGLLRSAATTAGSAGLLFAMTTDALSVTGRHFGFTILGAIEIFEACIVIAATAAIVVATVDAGHARVRILLERLQPGAVHGLERLADALASVAFVLLATGSAWLAADLWNGHEETEVLSLPLRWFRLFWILGSLTCAVIFAWRAARRRR